MTTIHVTMYDDHQRSFDVGDGLTWSHWKARIGPWGLAELVFWRADDTGRVHIPVSQVREWEISYAPLERDEQAPEVRPDADADEHHPEEPESLATLRRLLADNGAGWLDDYLRRRLGGDTFAEAVYAADQHASIHPSPAEPGPLEGVDLRTGQPIPDSCISTGALSHWWFEGADVQAVNGFVWSPGPGPHQRCSRCGAVRIKR